ncbi:helix-turn-helix domain-containing protein [Corynebacterium pseudogenitalium]|uniref:DNA-binding helix-turn-helix protein n=1 Tax=Corynebacterium pseudogenitalium ATCC 33035 TaxID=525264 RepID=E2S6N4_9CORY|nr:helix-turn-helix domain-containing protein [Corynebacterium pseudogenitalium]EFQ79676.1 DNA-binding helix-turn-helix protein [Corynebacterium pseudogenitalium ATCC 33035]
MGNVQSDITQYRLREAITPGELANRLGVAKSTVLAWERGDRNPSSKNLERLQELFRNRRLACIEGEEGISKPVTARLQALPFTELSPDDFENFYADFLNYKFPTADLVTRLGARGHKQYGMDVIVIKSGKIVFAVQCKREKSFSTAKAKEVFRKVAEEDLAKNLEDAEKVLGLAVTSCSPSLSLLAIEEPGWKVWDGSNLSREVRQLPRNQAVNLVDSYFPGYRASFLGIDEPSVWEHSSSAFGGPFENGPFHHDWKFVGYDEPLNQLKKILDRPGPSLALIVGQGGVGKSRLLKEVSSYALLTADVFVLSGVQEVGPDQFEFIPFDGPVVALIDDAHDKVALSYIARRIWERNKSTKIILGVRKSAFKRVLGDLERAQALPQNVENIELEGLSTHEALLLAEQVLGTNVDDRSTFYFAQRAKDSPLALVLGGHLIKNKVLAVTDFAADLEFRRRMLSSYVDFQASNLSISASYKVKEFLEVLALIQPFNSSSEECQAAVQSLCGLSTRQTIAFLRELEEVGLVQHRGASFRIIPDLIGEMLLAEAAFDQTTHTSTQFLEHSLSLLEGDVLQNAFVNVNRIELDAESLRVGNLPDSSLLWRWLQDELCSADAFDRAQLYSLLKEVAEFQPKRVLDAIEWGLKHPVSDYGTNNKQWETLYPNGEMMALPKMVQALQIVGHSYGHIDRALYLLLQIWKREEVFGQGGRLLAPDHSAREAIKKIVGFEVGKSVAYSERAMQYILDFDDFELPDSKFVLLVPLLEIECETAMFDGRVISFRSYPIRPEAVEPLRCRIIEAALEDFSTSDLNKAAKALIVIENVLRHPLAKFGRSVSSDELASWENRAEGLLDGLERVLKADEYASIKTVGVLVSGNNLRNTNVLRIRDAWARFVDKFAKTEDVKRQIVWNPDGIARLLPYERFRDCLEEQNTFIDDVIAGYKGAAPAVLLKDFQRRIEVTEQFFSRESGGHRFIQIAAEKFPSVGVLICKDRYLRGSLSLFSGSLISSALLGLAKFKQSFAVDWISRLYTQPDCEAEILNTLAYLDFSDENVQRVINILENSVSNRNEMVRVTVCNASLRLIDAGKNEAALRVVGKVAIGQSTSVLDAVWEFYLGVCRGEEQTALEKMIEERQSELLEFSNLDGTWLVGTFPEAIEEGRSPVIKFLEDRLHIWSANENFKSRAMPISLKESKGMPRDASFVVKLNQIADWMASISHSDILNSGVVDLAAALVGTWDADVLRIIATQISSGNREVYLLLLSAPVDICWKHPEEVVSILRIAERVGQHYLRMVEDAFCINMLTQLKSGTPGEIFPETLEQLERCKELAEAYQDLGAVASFYRELAERAEREAEWELASEQKHDGRRW